MLAKFNFFTTHVDFIVGVDEVGRGALAGPLLAGAVGLNRKLFRLITVQKWSKKVQDSKKIAIRLRQELNLAIRQELPWAIGFVSVSEINRWGLTRANQVAMRRAMEQLPKADLIIGDGLIVVPRSFAKFQPIVKADQNIWLVAAASIIAKVERDKMMIIEYHEQYPQYGFNRHVGYGTKFHREMLGKLGPTSIHRTSFKLI